MGLAQGAPERLRRLRPDPVRGGRDRGLTGHPQLILLGTGTAVPTPRRGPTALLVADGDDVTLIDPGPGAVQRACVAGFPIAAITRVLLTHHHPDHTLDLMALLFARKNPMQEPCPPLRVFGGPGTADLVERFRHVYGGWVSLPPDELSVVELAPGDFSLSAADGRSSERNPSDPETREQERGDGPEVRELARMTAYAVDHTPASLAYRFRFENGASLAVSGDTDVCDGAEQVAEDVDHYVLEAALPESMKSAGHLTPTEALQIGERSGCRHLILTHFYPRVDLVAARRAAAQSTMRVTFAEDGMRVPLVSDR